MDFKSSFLLYRFGVAIFNTFARAIALILRPVLPMAAHRAGFCHITNLHGILPMAALDNMDASIDTLATADGGFVALVYCAASRYFVTIMDAMGLMWQACGNVFSMLVIMVFGRLINFRAIRAGIITARNNSREVSMQKEVGLNVVMCVILRWTGIGSVVMVLGWGVIIVLGLTEFITIGRRQGRVGNPDAIGPNSEVNAISDH